MKPPQGLLAGLSSGRLSGPRPGFVPGVFWASSGRLFLRSAGLIFGAVLGPIFGYQKWPRKWGPVLIPTVWGPHFWVPKAAPFLGTQSGPFFELGSVAGRPRWGAPPVVPVVGSGRASGEAYTVVNLDERAILRGLAARGGRCVEKLEVVGGQRYARTGLRQARGHASRSSEFVAEVVIPRLGRPWPAVVSFANKSLVWKWRFPGCGGPGPLLCVSLIRV